MKLVVDTNIVFSALISRGSIMAEIISNPVEPHTFFAPELLIEELDRYAVKLRKASRIPQEDFSLLQNKLLQQIELISEALISEASWVQAFSLVRDIDEDDTPFIALTLELEATLWTGDKKLIEGLRQKSFHAVINTSDLRNQSF